MLRPAHLAVASLVAVLVAAGGPADAATLTVTTGLDTGDGVCDATCSLRDAVTVANATGTSNDIVLPAGTFFLTTTGGGEDANKTGDLDVTNDLTIRGAGPGATTIQAAMGDRVIDVLAGAGLRLFDLTLTGGVAPVDEGGGGIRDTTGGGLALQRVVVRGNLGPGSLTGYGGGIRMSGAHLSTDAVAIVGNAAWGGAFGGGIFLSGPGTSADLVNTTIAGNVGNTAGGGLYSNTPVPISMVNVTLAGNRSSNGAGGVDGDLSRLTARSSIITGNAGANCGVGVTLTSEGGNVADAACGLNLASDVHAADPLLEPLTLNAAMPVMLPAAGSPALDRAVGTCPSADATGLARPQGPRCDAGAAERPVPVVAPASSAPVTTPVAPIAAGLPRILGPARVGHVISCRMPVFRGATLVGRAWLRNGRAIRRATRATYRVTRADAGRVLTCRVTATGAGGRTVSVSLGILARA
ncbi:MAG: choice-of-anchor Q domain-containing protein [Thermoleophilia bacterium]